MKVIISIVSFNTKELTQKCLQTVFSDKHKHDVEIWIVDNNSSDGTAQMIKQNFPKVKLIENQQNVGFGRAHNQVFKEAQGDYYIVLNSDTEIEPGVIDGMVDFMLKNPDCGLSSCKILGYDGKLQPNGGDLPFGGALFNWLFNLEMFGIKENFHRAEPEYYKTEHEVGWISGNFFILSKEVLDKIKGFNEIFFMYFEDTELCFRIKKAGFKILYTPKVFIKHLSGGSSDNPRLRQFIGEYTGLLIFYKELYGSLAAFWIRILVYKSIVLRILAFAIIGKLNYSVTYAKVIASL